MTVSLVACGPKKTAVSTQSATGARKVSAVPGTSSSAASSPVPTPVAPAAKSGIPPVSLEPPSYAGYEPLPILCYHHVDPKMKNDIAITPAVFEAQLQKIKSLGYHTIDCRQLAAYHAQGTKLPTKPVMITFDDGWLNQYTYAAPLLEKYGMSATFFVYPKMIGGGNAFMKRSHVKSLAKRGFDIESHTWGHVSLVRKPDFDATKWGYMVQPQFTKTNDWIESAVGTVPVALAYPYGFYDTTAAGLLKKAGYTLGFTVDEGVADARPWDSLGLKRFVIYSGESIAQFERRLTSTPIAAIDIQPGPGSRVVGTTATLTADISAVPTSVTGIAFASGSAMGRTTIVSRDGKRFAVAHLKRTRRGFRNVSLRGTDAAGHKFVTMWGLVMGE